MRFKVISLLVLASLLPARLFAADPSVTGPVRRKPRLAIQLTTTRSSPRWKTSRRAATWSRSIFFSGTANRYETPEGATGKVIDGNHKYQTRLVVRRPADAQQVQRDGDRRVEQRHIRARSRHRLVPDSRPPDPIGLCLGRRHRSAHRRRSAQGLEQGSLRDRSTSRDGGAIDERRAELRRLRGCGPRRPRRRTARISSAG